MATLRLYNLGTLGVNVDTDNLHVPAGSFRSAQNLRRASSDTAAESIINRSGLRNLNSVVMSGSVLGGVVLPAFEAGSGESTMFLGFGD
jgi:hypothetical protein